VTLAICAVMCKNLAYGGAKRTGSDQTSHVLRGVWSEPELFVTFEHLQNLQKKIYEYKYAEKADLGKHCSLLHKPGFPKWHHNFYKRHVFVKDYCIPLPISPTRPVLQKLTRPVLQVGHKIWYEWKRSWHMEDTWEIWKPFVQKLIQMTLDISKLWGLFFTNSNYPKCKWICTSCNLDL